MLSFFEIIKPKKNDPTIEITKLLSIKNLSREPTIEAKSINIKIDLFIYRKFLQDKSLYKIIQEILLVPLYNVKINVNISFF